jgi:hypothetical protein
MECLREASDDTGHTMDKAPHSWLGKHTNTLGTCITLGREEGGRRERDET